MLDKRSTINQTMYLQNEKAIKSVVAKMDMKKIEKE